MGGLASDVHGKDSQRPTLAQLGLSKWQARQAFAFAALGESQMEAALDGMIKKRPGYSATAIVERHQGRTRSGRNPLLRAWRVALKHERLEFLQMLQRIAFFAEREDALGDDDQKGGA